MATDDIRYVEIHRPRNTPQAYLVKNLLEDAGVSVRIDNELLQGLAGELPMGWASAPRILVPEDDVEKARAILEQMPAESSSHRTDEDEDGSMCLACGAEIPDDKDRCPACGWSYKGDAG